MQSRRYLDSKYGKKISIFIFKKNGQFPKPRIWEEFFTREHFRDSLR